MTTTYRINPKHASFPSAPRKSKYSFVYLISEGHEGPIKIGRSTSPHCRLIELQTGNPRKLRVLETYCFFHGATVDIERLLHEEFACRSLGGEWFDMTEEFILDYMPDFFLSEGLEVANGAD